MMLPSVQIQFGGSGHDVAVVRLLLPTTISAIGARDLIVARTQVSKSIVNNYGL